MTVCIMSHRFASMEIHSGSWSGSFEDIANQILVRHLKQIIDLKFS